VLALYMLVSTSRMIGNPPVGDVLERRDRPDVDHLWIAGVSGIERPPCLRSADSDTARDHDHLRLDVAVVRPNALDRPFSVSSR